MMSEAKAIASSIASMEDGAVFTAADFSGIAGARNAGNILGRMFAQGRIGRAMRGVYYKPEHSDLLGIDVAPSADAVVKAIARSNKWIIAPSGDTALNALGLDEQVPARCAYVSSGPYKRYEYGPYSIELRHRANRDLLDCSQLTATIVQALKALGKDNVGSEVAEKLAASLAQEEVDAFREEASGLTSWIAEFAKELWRMKHGQDRQSKR